MEEIAHAKKIALRRHEVQLIGIGPVAKLSMGTWQNGNFRDGKNKSNDTQNQKPKGAFDRHNHTHNQYRRHDPISNNR
jgi:hypothetical protein